MASAATQRQDSPVDESPANGEQGETKIKSEPMSQVARPDTNNDSNNNNNDNSNNNSNDDGTHAGGNNQGDNSDDGNADLVTNDANEESNNQVAVNNSGNESENDNEKTNLIVNYLPQQMSDEQFLNLFEKFGKMKSCKIVRNRMTGYSYGFGFVDFETHEQSIKAIEELNGQEIDNKKIKVAFARPAGQDIKQANLYVKNIPTTWTQDDVRKVFEPYGQIIQVRVLGNDRGVAFVLYDLRKQAEDALDALNGVKVEGCEEPFEIKFAAEKKGEKRGNRGGANRRGGRDRNNQRSGSLSGQRNNQSNNRNNRGSSDNRRSTSQGRGNNNGGNNMCGRGGNNQYGSNANGASGGVGPMRQQQTNRMARYTPFVSAQQTPAMAPAPPQSAPNAYYGYAQQQPMLPYMMPNQMMQMGQLPMGQQSMGMTGAPPLNPYAMAPQMGPIGYAQPPISQPSMAMNTMYNVASNTMNNAAQMQPQLGQPMSMRTAAGGGVGANVASGGGGSQQGEGITLFVYNIGPDCDENQLRDMFTPYGMVTRTNVVRKTPGGETKGFGFVTLKTRDQASAAINALNNSMKNGRTLQVSFKK